MARQGRTLHHCPIRIHHDYRHDKILGRIEKLNLSVPLTDTTEFHSWILRWGQHVKVIKPKELRESMRNIGKRIAENHK